MNENNDNNESNDVLEVLEDASGYAGNLYTALKQTVVLFRQQKIREALTLFIDATEGLSWLLDAVSGLKKSHTDFEDIELEDISNFLTEMVEAAENMDYVLLADLIEYEIMPILDEWGHLMDNVRGI